MNKTNETLVLFLYYIGIIALSRVIPHPPNFTPVIAMAIFMPYMTRDIYLAMLVPVTAMFVSDLYLGLHSFMIWIYGTIILCTLVSRYLNLITMSILAPVIFFITTNFGVWLTSTLYPKTLDGLILCYTMAIPFFRNTLLSTIFYMLLIGAIYEVIKRSYTWLRKYYYLQ